MNRPYAEFFPPTPLPITQPANEDIRNALAMLQADRELARMGAPGLPTSCERIPAATLDRVVELLSSAAHKVDCLTTVTPAASRQGPDV